MQLIICLVFLNGPSGHISDIILPAEVYLSARVTDSFLSKAAAFEAKGKGNVCKINVRTNRRHSPSAQGRRTETPRRPGLARKGAGMGSRDGLRGTEKAGRRGRLDQATGQRPGRRSSGGSARMGNQCSGPGWWFPLWWGRQGPAPGSSSDRLESPGSLGFPVCIRSGWSPAARHSLVPPNSAYVLLPDGHPGSGAGAWGGCVSTAPLTRQ